MRILLIMFLVSVATLLIVTPADGGASAEAALTPASLIDSEGRIPVCDGHTFQTRTGSLVVEATGYGVRDGFRYVFTVRLRGRVRPITGEVTGGRLTGTAYWLARSPRRTVVRRTHLRGRFGGTFTSTEDYDLAWEVNRGPAWGGSLRFGNPSQIKKPLEAAVCALYQVEGTRGNDAFIFPETGRRSQRLDQRERIGEDLRRRRVSLVRGQDAGTTGTLRGIYMDQWRVGDLVDASMGIATVGRSGEIAVLGQRTRVFFEDDNTTLERDGQWIRLSVGEGLPPQLRAGDVLISGIGDGVLGRVRSVGEIDPRTVEVYLEPAALSEAVSDGHLSLSESFTGSGDEGGQALEVEAGERYQFGFGGTYSVTTGSLTVALPASLTFSPSVEFNAHLSATELSACTLTVSGELTASVGIQVELDSATDFGKDIEIYDSGRKPFSGAIGVVPVAGYVRCAVYLRLEGSLSGMAAYETSLTLADRVALTMAYDKESGWHTTSDLDNSLSLSDPLWRVDYPEGSLRVSLVPVLELNLYGLAGATVEPRAFGEVTAGVWTAAGSGYLDWTTDVGFALDASVYAGILDHRLLEARWTDLLSVEKTVGSGTVLLWSPAPTPPPPPPQPPPPPPPPPPSPPPVAPPGVDIRDSSMETDLYYISIERIDNFDNDIQIAWVDLDSVSSADNIIELEIKLWARLDTRLDEGDLDESDSDIRLEDDDDTSDSTIEGGTVGKTKWTFEIQALDTGTAYIDLDVAFEDGTWLHDISEIKVRIQAR